MPIADGQETLQEGAGLYFALLRRVCSPSQPFKVETKYENKCTVVVKIQILIVIGILLAATYLSFKINKILNHLYKDLVISIIIF
jgi:hypothetical protein